MLHKVFILNKCCTFELSIYQKILKKDTNNCKTEKNLFQH